MELEGRGEDLQVRSGVARDKAGRMDGGIKDGKFPAGWFELVTNLNMILLLTINDRCSPSMQREFYTLHPICWFFASKWDTVS